MSIDTEIIVSDDQIKDLHPLIAEIRSMQVTTPDEYILAGEYLSKIKEKIKAIRVYFKGNVDKAKASYESAKKLRDDALLPYEQADEHLRMIGEKYINLQECIRKEAEAKAQREAEAKAKAERERIIAQAEKAIEKGNDGKAEALLEKAEQVYATPVFVAPVVEKTVKFEGGGSATQSKDIVIEITDMTLLIKACADGKVPVTVFAVKQQVLKSWVKAAGIKNGRVPGLIIKDNIGMRIR